VGRLEVRGRIRLGPAEGDGGGAELGVGRQDAVVTVAMNAWGWDEPSDSLEEFEGGEPELDAPVEIGFGEPVEELCLG